MRFKDFISEATASAIKLRNKAALQLFDGFKENFNTTIDKEIILYRAAKTEGGKRLQFNFEGTDIVMRISRVTGRTEPRNSRSGDNLRMFASVDWEGYPKRTYSTFATQNVKHARMFGDPKIVIPADSVNNFGWMPEDFNQSSYDSSLRKNKFMLDDLTTKISSLAGCVGDLFRADNAKGTDFRNKVMDIAEDNRVYDELKATFYRPQIPQEKWRGLISFCDSMLRKMKQLESMDSRDPYSVLQAIHHLSEFLKDKELASVSEAFELIKPETFGAINYNSFDQTPKQEHDRQKTEIWFEGDYLLITFDHDLLATTPSMQTDILKMIRDML